MSNTLFIQFYSKFDNVHYTDLGNGFSDTYDFCSNIGDMVWMNHVKNENYDNEEFIIKKGKCYISVLYTNQLKRVYMWAEKTPNVKFIVGGPVSSLHFPKLYKLPNLIITNKSVEDWFNIKKFSYPWKLILPDDISENDGLQFTYGLDRRCYWNACTFCKLSNDNHRIRKDIDFEPIKKIKNKKVIRLGTYALTPKAILKCFPKIFEIENTEKIRTYLRPSYREVKALSKIKTSMDSVVFHIGLEFPTKRMWNQVNKGYSLDDTISFMELSKKLKYNVFASFILGWTNLIEEDLIELEKYMKNIYCSHININRLLVFSESKLYDIYNEDRFNKNDPFVFAYSPYPDRKQIELNNKALDIIKYYAEKKNINFREMYSHYFNISKNTGLSLYE